MDNIKIVNSNKNSHKCLIAFSSNGLRKEQTYEFENICSSRRIKKHFNKIIFVKDTTCHFYIDGISNELNNVYELLKYLDLVTASNEIYTIGYSSGGYMALLTSVFLENTKRTIAPGAIIDVTKWRGAYQNYLFSDLECVQKASDLKKKYLQLANYLTKSFSENYAFYAGNANADKEIIEEIKNNSFKLNFISFNTSKHGEYCYPFDYKYLLTKPDKKLKKIFNRYENKMISPLRFSLALQGPFSFAYNYIYKLLRGLLRRLKH